MAGLSKLPLCPLSKANILPEIQEFRKAINLRRGMRRFSNPNLGNKLNGRVISNTSPFESNSEEVDPGARDPIQDGEQITLEDQLFVRRFMRMRISIQPIQNAVPQADQR
jgi:hypothetical protein